MIARSNFFTATGFVGIVSFGYMLLTVQSFSHRDGPLPHPRAKYDNHKAEIKKLLDDVKSGEKTFREKMEAAYDGAINTHVIGFPTSRSEESHKHEERIKEECDETNDQ